MSEPSVTRFGTLSRELRDAFAGPGRGRHVLPAAPRARAGGAGQGAADRARGWPDPPVHADLDAALRERSFLHTSIGRAGRLALKPLQVTSDRDRWHRYLLGGARPRRRTAPDAFPISEKAGLRAGDLISATRR